MRALVIVLAVLLSTSAFANTTMRCGKYLLQGGVGTTQYEVLAKCGPPTYVDEGRFIYDRGSRTLLKVLVFHGGALNAVRSSADR